MQPPEAPHRIILADDQTIFRAGAAKVLAAEPDMRVIAEVQHASHLPPLLETCTAEAAAEHGGGVVLLLAQTLGADLPRTSAALRSCGSSLVLLLENRSSPELALRPYAECLLPRNVSSDRLLESIRRVATGRSCDDLELPSPEGDDPVGQRVLERLTTRELQIIGLVVQGLKNREVAHSLSTQEQVVKNYLRSIYDKTGVSDRLELALFVLHHQLLADAASQAVPLPGTRPH